MNEIITARDIEMVTSDIRYAQRQGARQLLSNLIEIGRLLVEAKSMVSHGEWGRYLEEKVDYSQSTANNLMKLYQEYGDNQESFFGTLQDSQTFGNLSYTQALALIALPAEERKEFVETHDVADMSTRQLEQAIKERNDARQERDDNAREIERLQKDNERITAGMVEAADKLEVLQEAERLAKQEVSAAQEKLTDLQGKLAKARENEKKAKEALKAAKDHPEIPESVMEEMRQQVAADAAKQATEEIQKQLDAALKQAETATAQVKDAEEKLKAAQKAVQMANPDVAVFQSLYVQLQETWNRTVGAYQKVRLADENSAAGCLRALNAAITKFQSDVAPEK